MSDNPRRQYRKIPGQTIVAVQLDLDTTGFDYRKWGDIQHCKQGDWLVNNAGEIYTVDQTTFAKTYRPVSRGLFEKTECVWAKVAEVSGSVKTQEGSTQYEAGDYLVSNDAEGNDAYSISKEKFEAMYEPVNNTA